MTLILIQENNNGHIADQWYRVIILNISGSWNMNMKGPLEKRRNIWCHWSSFGFRCWQFSGFLGILPQKLPTLGWKDPWLVAPWRKARAARLAVQGFCSEARTKSTSITVSKYANDLQESRKPSGNYPKGRGFPHCLFMFIPTHQLHGDVCPKRQVTAMLWEASTSQL
jgi:hypothetical protein